MIKKFREFINESKKARDILSLEDIEDQFLRLNDVYDCRIIWGYELPEKGLRKYKIYNRNIDNIHGLVMLPRKLKEQDQEEDNPIILKGINDELLNIKHRIENIYPDIKMTIDKFDPRKNKKDFSENIIWFFKVAIKYDALKVLDYYKITLSTK